MMIKIVGNKFELEVKVETLKELFSKGIIRISELSEVEKNIAFKAMFYGANLKKGPSHPLLLHSSCDSEVQRHLEPRYCLDINMAAMIKVPDSDMYLLDDHDVVVFVSSQPHGTIFQISYRELLKIIQHSEK